MTGNVPRTSFGGTPLMVAAVALVVLLTAGLVVQAYRSGEKQEHLEAALQQAKIANETALAARATEIAKLKKRLKQDEESYALLVNECEQLRRQLAAGTPVAGQPPSGADDARRSPGAWMERLRQENPERFQQFTQAWRQRQQAADEAYKDQMAALARRAKHATSPAEAEVLAQVTAALDQIQQLRQNGAALADLSPEERQVQAQQMGEQMRQAYATLDALREQDRAIQAENLATKVGLRGQDAQTVQSAVSEIYRNTQYTVPWGRGGFGGGSGMH